MRLSSRNFRPAVNRLPIRRCGTPKTLQPGPIRGDKKRKEKLKPFVTWITDATASGSQNPESLRRTQDGTCQAAEASRTAA